MEKNALKNVTQYAEDLLLSTAEGDDTIQLWEPKTLAVFGTLKEPNGIPPHCVDTFHNNSDYVAYALFKNNAVFYKQLSTPESTPIISRVEFTITYIKTLRKGNVLMLGTLNGDLIVRHSYTGKPLKKIDGAHKSAVTHIETNILGDIVVTSSNDLLIKVWNYADLVNASAIRPTPIAFYNAHILSITGIKVGRLGLCYSSSLDGYFKVWNMFNAEKKCKLEIAIQTPITALCINHDESIAYMGTEKGGLIRIAINDKKERKERVAHNCKITTIAMSSDSSFLATGDTAGLIIVWNTNIDKLKESRIHKSAISNILPCIRPIQLYGLSSNHKKFQLEEPVKFTEGELTEVPINLSKDELKLKKIPLSSALYISAEGMDGGITETKYNKLKRGIEMLTQNMYGQDYV